MQALINHLQRSRKFTAHQIDHIQSRLIFKTLQKGEFFSEPEKPAKELAFVLKGILRVLFHNPEGQEITHYFIDEGNFAVAADPEVTTDPVTPISAGSVSIPEDPRRREHIQAVMRSDLAFLSSHALLGPSFTQADWAVLKEYINARALLEQAEQVAPTLAGDATARYKKFMDQYPQIAGRVPLSYLASYLGITQQSLSRIRKQLTKKSPPRED